MIGLTSSHEEYEPPKCIITEITITNVSKYPEVRIDAILEYNGNQCWFVDWKTYDVNPINSSGIENWDLLVNLFLANHRYTRDEATLQ